MRVWLRWRWPWKRLWPPRPPCCSPAHDFKDAQVTPPPDSLPPLGSSKASLNWTSWIYGLLLPLVYLVVELSFSNELIHTLGDSLAR